MTVTLTDRDTNKVAHKQKQNLDILSPGREKVCIFQLLFVVSHLGIEITLSYAILFISSWCCQTNARWRHFIVCQYLLYMLLWKLTVAACVAVTCPFCVSRPSVLQFSVEQCSPNCQRTSPASVACCSLRQSPCKGTNKVVLIAKSLI